MISFQDLERILNLLASLLLAWASYRSYRWTKNQARIENLVAAKKDAPDESPGNPAARGPASIIEAASETLSRPFFDVRAYWLFLLGFCISCVASVVGLLTTHAAHEFARWLLSAWAARF
jgi:hypothetical protein